MIFQLLPPSLSIEYRRSASAVHINALVTCNKMRKSSTCQQNDCVVCNKNYVTDFAFLVLASPLHSKYGSIETSTEVKRPDVGAQKVRLWLDGRLHEPQQGLLNIRGNNLSYYLPSSSNSGRRPDDFKRCRSCKIHRFGLHAWMISRSVVLSPCGPGILAASVSSDVEG